ncbi:MAG: DMT family transporter, partial [Actinomycetia bacterium]|nr:DMT family transporter [Actinomycetes bacterium]
NAIRLTFASNASVIISVAPLFTALIAGWILGGSKPRWYFYAGFVTAMVGITLVSFNSASGFHFSPAGDLLMLGAALVWAIYCNITRRISELGHHTILVTRRIFAYGLLFMIPALFIFDFHWGLARFASPVNALNILFLGLGASALCYVTWNYALKVLGAVRTSVYIYAGPVVTMVAAAIVLAEPLTWMLVIGAALALAGLVISEQGQRWWRHR